VRVYFTYAIRFSNSSPPDTCLLTGGYRLNQPANNVTDEVVGMKRRNRTAAPPAKEEKIVEVFLFWQLGQVFLYFPLPRKARYRKPNRRGRRREMAF
jgi:hypothetical protein